VLGADTIAASFEVSRYGLGVFEEINADRAKTSRHLLARYSSNHLQEVE